MIETMEFCNTQRAYYPIKEVCLMKKTCLFLIILFLSFVLFLPNLPASDYTKWHLPEGAKARIGKGSISGITFSSDNERLVVASDIGIWVYDAHNGKELDLLPGSMNRFPTGDTVFSSDGRMLAAISTSKELLQLWDVDTGQHLKTLTGHNSWVNNVCFSPDGTTLAGGDGNGNIFFWDTATGELRKTLIIKHKELVFDVCFSPDGTMLASSSRPFKEEKDLFEKENEIDWYPSVVQLWDVDTGQQLKTFRQEWWARHLCFSPDGTILASSDGFSKGNVNLWSIATGQHLKTLTHESSISSLCFSPDGTVLTSGSADGTVRLWDPVTGHIQNTLTSHTSAVRNMCYSPDSRMLASISYDGIVKLWSVSTGHLQNTLTGHTGSVQSICFSPVGTTLAIGSVGNVRLWNTRTTHLQNTYPKFNVSSVCFSLDGTTLAIASMHGKVGNQGNVSLQVTSTGQNLNTFTEDKGWIKSVCFSPSGNIIAYGIVNNRSVWADTRDQHDQYISVILRSIKTGQILKTLAYSTDSTDSWTNSVCFSPDGTTLASGGHDNNVHLWDATTGAHKAALRGHKSFIESVIFSPDGTLLASGSMDKTIRLWDAATGQHLKTLITGYGYSDVCFSPDGQMIASSGDSGKVLLWSTTTGQLLETLVGHTSYVTNVCFSADGSTLASGSSDGTVLLWNTGVSTPQPQTQDSTQDSKQQDSTPLTPEQIAKKALAATVLIVMEDVNGKPLGSGSGFFIGKGLIATNYHVVEKGIKKVYKQVGKDKWYNITDTVKIDKQRDLAILKVSDGDAPALPLGNSDGVQIGQSVYAVGNPIGFLEGTFAPGFVSSIRGKVPNKSIQITAPISPGSSGGPLLNDKGQVIGIIVGGITEGQNLNFAIPSNYLKELLDKVKKRK